MNIQLLLLLILRPRNKSDHHSQYSLFGKVFDKWTGDISYVSNINSSTSTVTMPGKAISLTVTYKDFNVQKSGKDGDKFKVLSLVGIS